MDSVLKSLKGGKKRFTATMLRTFPRISSGQFANLHIDTGKSRVWLSRTTVEDGAPYNNQIIEETLRGGRWVTTAEYEG